MSEVLAPPSRIEKIEVFRNEALITRRAVLASGLAGGGEVLLRGLPLTLDDSSVRSRLHPVGRIRVRDLHLELDLGERQGAHRTEGEQAVRGLIWQRVGLRVERQRALDRIALLESLAASRYPENKLPERIAFTARHPLQSRLALADLVRQQLQASRDEVRALERKVREIEDALAEARHKIQRESEAAGERLKVFHKAARLFLEGSSPEVTVELSYRVPAARWVPQYELRVFEERDQAELVLQALVAQRTGEDWPRCELALSTADLQRSAELPELPSWRIGKAQPLKPTGWRELPDNLEELFEGYDAGQREIPGPALPAPIRLPEMPALIPVDKATRGKEPGGQVAFTRELLSRLEQGEADQEEVDEILDEEAMPAGEEPGAPCDDEVTLMASAAEPVACMDVDRSSIPLPAPAAASFAPQAAGRRAPPAPRAPAKSMPLGRAQHALREEATPVRSMPEAKRMALRSAAAGGGPPDLSEDDFDREADQAGEWEDQRLGVDRAALAYPNLRMAPPSDDQDRGQLQAAGMAERLVEQLAEAAPEAANALKAASPRTLLRALGAAPARLDDLELPLHAVELEESAGHFAVRYPAESPGEVLSDGILHALTLLRRQGAVTRVFRCVPSLDPQVYQLAMFGNPLQIPLLSGGVKVYREGDFVADAPLETTPPGKPITVNLGVEPSIAVARNTHFEETTEGLLGGGTVLTHRVEIEVRSKLNRPVRVEIFERLPVSHQEDIKVTLVSSTPAAQPYDQAERGQIVHGGYRWVLELKPLEKKPCSLVYKISIPSKQVLVGGNRRD